MCGCRQPLGLLGCFGRVLFNSLFNAVGPEERYTAGTRTSMQPSVEPIPTLPSRTGRFFGRTIKRLVSGVGGRMRYVIRFESRSPLPTSVENTIYETLVAALGRIDGFETAQTGYLPTM